MYSQIAIDYEKNCTNIFHMLPACRSFIFVIHHIISKFPFWKGIHLSLAKLTHWFWPPHCSLTFLSIKKYSFTICKVIWWFMLELPNTAQNACLQNLDTPLFVSQCVNFGRLNCNIKGFTLVSRTTNYKIMTNRHVGIF